MNSSLLKSSSPLSRHLKNKEKKKENEKERKKEDKHLRKKLALKETSKVWRCWFVAYLNPYYTPTPEERKVLTHISLVAPYREYHLCCKSDFAKISISFHLVVAMVRWEEEGIWIWR